MPLTIITQNEKMRGILEKLRMVVASDSTVLLIGETGVGKEIFAEYIHRTSHRSRQPFIKIGLAAMPTELMASELFGHEKGAFTSASSEKKGLFEIAHTGTIFLDDIDDVPLEIQTKLLRVLESRELMRIGGTKPIPIDIRLICASKVDLRELVRAGRFRADLLYRINVVPVHIPPLRARKDDIPLLVEHFIRRFAPDKQLAVDPDAMRALLQYHWPGNVRELRNVIQRATLFANGSIQQTHLPEEIGLSGSVAQIVKACSICFDEGKMDLPEVVSCVEQNLIRQVLEYTAGNQSETARKLGMRLSTLRDKIKRHQLQRFTRSNGMDK